jgi:hypothetical protein
MKIMINNRWQELEPEVQLSLTRLINHLASIETIKLTWECSDDGESGQSVKLVPLA